MTGDFHEGRGNVAWWCNRLSFGCFILAILAYPERKRGPTPMGRGRIFSLEVRIAMQIEFDLPMTAFDTPAVEAAFASTSSRSAEPRSRPATAITTSATSSVFPSS